MAASKCARDWEAPAGMAATASSSAPQLVLYNSLIDEKVPFVPAAGVGSKQITWYTCGPTVYDVAHMGHARNYVSFDIVRRVLEDYFGYNCLFVMNVTDVDDKIILRARRNYLLQQYRSSSAGASEVRAYAVSALEAARNKQQGKVNAAEQLVKEAADEAAAASESGRAQSKRDELAKALKNEQHTMNLIMEAAAKLQALPADASKDDVLGAVGDYVAEALDKEKGAEVTDGSIYRAHAAKFEAEFLDDMSRLGCRTPDVLTRVSEFIPEIITYVTRITDNGMAYVSNGSVYFDTGRFRSCGHTYGKLKPWAVGSAALAAEGEANFETSEKRSPQDFALWKASKPGEPFWESPWGKGRPGWHIECSAMASHLLGAKMDIHSGGEDLRFPHHDNEMAQAEAHYHDEGCKQWVNYFLHSGHLEIEGLKMSKSLKNFITIKEALKTFTPRQLRLLFALQPWNRPMMYGEQARGEMRAREAQLRNFFQNVEVAVRGLDQVNTNARWQAEEFELNAAIGSSQTAVHTALCDNINTAAALDAVSDLIKAVNIYLAKKQEGGAASAPVQALLLRKATSYVTRVLAMFGIVEAPADRPGLGDASSSGAGSAAEAKSAAYLDAFAAFRDEVRSLAKARSEPSALLAACDRLRDGTLVNLGVRLEDRPDGKAVWKLDDPAVLRQEQEERAAAAAAAARNKVASKLSTKAKEREKWAKLASLPPVEVQLADKYSKFDPATGEPTHDKEGAELEGKAKDKARKDVEKARKLVEPLKKKLEEDPAFLTKLEAEVAELTAQLAALGGAVDGAEGAAK